MKTEERVSFGDRKPYYLPERWEDLNGPGSGVIELPVYLHWVPDRRLNLDEVGQARVAYRAVLCEGLAEDQIKYLNPGRLQELWLGMALPPRVRRLWREKFPDHLPEKTHGFF